MAPRSEELCAGCGRGAKSSCQFLSLSFSSNCLSASQKIALPKSPDTRASTDQKLWMTVGKPSWAKRYCFTCAMAFIFEPSWKAKSFISKVAFGCWRCWLKRCTTCEIPIKFLGGKIRTAAWETAPQIALRDYSKEAVGEGQYVRFWWRESSVQSNAYFTRDFLLLRRIWCHQEGV